jgi:hypothetical protein
MVTCVNKYIYQDVKIAEICGYGKICFLGDNGYIFL